MDPQDRILPNYKEICFFLIKGGITAIGFIAVEWLYHRNTN
jgi:hypothetical protein